jgi:protease YdgD
MSLIKLTLICLVHVAMLSRASAQDLFSTNHEASESNDFGVFLSPHGADTRVPMLDHSFPWSAIGRVMLDEGNGWAGRCTGTMVGRYVMVTAAHCVLSNGAIHSVTFQPNYANGQSAGIASSIWINVGTLSPNTDRANDWAVVELNQPLGDSQGFMGIRNIDGARFPINVEYAGYSQDFENGNVAGFESLCQIHEEFQQQIFGHDCSSDPGGSGGPLFVVNPGVSATIYAINTRGITNTVYRNYNPNVANIAVMNAAFANTVARYKSLFDR